VDLAQDDEHDEGRVAEITWTTETRKLGELVPWPRNPRQIRKDQAKRLRESFEQFGQVETIAIGPGCEVYNGHQRLAVLMEQHGAGYEVEVRVSSRPLSEKEREKLTVFLHEGAAGEWNMDELANWDLGDLADWGFDLDARGLELPVDEPPDEPGAQVDKAEELRAKWGVEPGQLWQLGEHRLICGDCTDAAVVARLMGGEKAAICLTDPPYGLGEGKASGKNNYDQYEDTRENLIELAAGWLPIAREISKVVVFSPGVTNAWIYPEADWIMCWFYGGGQLRSSWGFNCWQPFLCYGKDPSLAAGRGGRPDAVDMNTPANAKDIDHPCPKPVKLWEWFIERLSFGDGDVFYEPFCGSGTTIIACENLKRKCRAIELDPKYVAVALERWATMTHREPKLVEGD
jgi:hypothetical protein